MFGDAPFSESVVGEALADAWGMSAAAVEYAQIGYGSHHWIVTDDRGGRWLVTADRADGQPVAAAYRLAHSLGQRFDFVRAPLLCQAGAVVLERDDRLISLWPWVEGRGGAFGDDPSPDDVAAVSRCLRMLHDYSEVPVDPRLVDDWGVPGRAILEELLDEPIGSVGFGPYASEVAGRVAANGQRLFGLLAQFDDLAARGREHVELVVTHGEPHVANVVHAGSGVVLIDWDTVRWAPRERDLWWLPGDSWREAYGLEQPVSEDAIEMYRIRWTLMDIVDFVPALIAAPEPTPDLEVALAWVRKLLPL